MKNLLETYLRIGKEMGIPQEDLIVKGGIIMNPDDPTYFTVDILGKERNGLTPNWEINFRIYNVLENNAKKLNGEIPRLEDLTQPSFLTLSLLHNFYDPLVVIGDFTKDNTENDEWMDCWKGLENHFEGLNEEDLIRKLLEFYKNGPPEEYKD